MILFSYLSWHYSDGAKILTLIAKNYTLSQWYSYGISFHARTLFYPWRRQLVLPERNLGLFGRIASVVLNKVIDMYFRFFAAIVRSTVIITGLMVVTATYTVLAIAVVGWLLWPPLVCISIVYGFTLFT